MKISRPVLFLLFITVVAAAVLLTQDDSSKSPSAKKLPAASKSKASTAFTDEDFKATYPPLKLASANVFKPIIGRTKTTGPAGEKQPNLIPPAYAGGESNWSFTGTAQVDGQQLALVENSTTQDGAFLKVGDHWKNSLVASVMDDGVVLTADDGESLTLTSPQIDPEAKVAKVTPLNPTANPLQGQIGGMTITPDATLGGGAAGAPVIIAPGGNIGGGMNMGGGGRTRGGGRGNRGGGGGGRGNFGGGRGNAGGN